MGSFRISRRVLEEASGLAGMTANQEPPEPGFPANGAKGCGWGLDGPSGPGGADTILFPFEASPGTRPHPQLMLFDLHLFLHGHAE